MESVLRKLAETHDFS